MLRQEDLRTETGRCEGGTFVRLVHIPTGISRSLGPLRGARQHPLIQGWLREIEAELLGRGLSEYVVPAYRTRQGGRKT